MKTTITAIAALAFLAACDDAAKVASRNISKAADQFEVNRRIVFVNGITDKYMLSITGKCSIGSGQGVRAVTVTCKVGPNQYKKHYLGLSDNVTFVAEHLEPTKASEYHYRVVFKPQAIIPDIDLRGSAKELVNPTRPKAAK